MESSGDLMCVMCVSVCRFLGPPPSFKSNQSSDQFSDLTNGGVAKIERRIRYYVCELGFVCCCSGGWSSSHM